MSSLFKHTKGILALAVVIVTTMAILFDTKPDAFFVGANLFIIFMCGADFLAYVRSFKRVQV